ncbi:hypothetical protein CSW62_25145 [Caulobacter sp. FWC2]|nr:hypothetical protein CSW62_25145 [Caulobacter sp. FWC2]
MSETPPPGGAAIFSGALADIVLNDRPTTPRAELVTHVFEGPSIVPERRVRDRLGNPYNVVRAPAVLNYRHGLTALTGFLTKIRRGVLRRDRRVYVDLSACVSIDIVACMLLTAELQRCHSLRPGSIAGCDPAASGALEVLSQLGFHRQLNIRDQVGPPADWIATIRSAATTQEMGPLMAEVADLSLKAWGDRAFTNQIHAALNEAMTNVIMHAYPDVEVDQSACLPGQWWAAGILDVEKNSAWFFALDQGVGLPRTAVKNYSGLLRKFDIDPLNPPDHLIIAAALKEARTQTGLDQHGKGLTSMVRLIDEKAAGGSIQIISRQGEHIIVKNPDHPNAQLRRVEFGRQLEAELPGTLIVWKVNGPKGR